MAAAARSPLRRWKPFFDTFSAVDDAIEASDPAAGGHLRDEFRSARGRIVELLCGAEDDAVAEELCLALDDAMAESLATLRVAAVASGALGTTDLARAIAALGRHGSARIRGLAGDVVGGWRAAVEADLARARAAKEALDKLSVSDERISHEDDKRGQVKGAPPLRINSNGAAPAKDSAPLQPRKSVPIVAAGRDNTAKVNPARNAPQMLHKKTPPPAVGHAGGDHAQSEKTMEATKRKLREGYQEVEDAKRQRKIKVIEAPKMLEQRQRKMHPILRERSQARCASSTAVRRSLMSSLQKV